MSKLPNATREGLSAEQLKIWDRIFEGRTGGGGPYSMLMHSPEMAQHFAATEDYFRNHSLLPDADREIIILTAAREVSAHYAWTRHEIRADKVGINLETIEALRAHADADKFTGKERLLVEFTRTLMNQHELPEELFGTDGKGVRQGKVYRSRRPIRPLHHHRHSDKNVRSQTAGGK